MNASDVPAGLKMETTFRDIFNDGPFPTGNVYTRVAGFTADGRPRARDWTGAIVGIAADVRLEPGAARCLDCGAEVEFTINPRNGKPEFVHHTTGRGTLCRNSCANPVDQDCPECGCRKGHWKGGCGPDCPAHSARDDFNGAPVSP